MLYKTLKLIPWNKNWGCSLHTQRLFLSKPQPNLNCWESHGTFLKVFLHKILAQAPILQLVAFSSNMLRYASIFNFYRHSRPGTLLGKSWKIFGIVPLTQFFDMSGSRPKIIFFLQGFIFDQKCWNTLFLTKICLTKLFLAAISSWRSHNVTNSVCLSVVLFLLWAFEEFKTRCIRSVQRMF